MTESNQTNTTIQIPKEFVLSTLPELKVTVDGIVEDKPSLHFDGSEVDRVDGAALQFLWQCYCHCATKEMTFVLDKPTDKVRDALADLGMQDLLLDS